MKSFQLSGFKTLFCVAVLATTFMVGCSNDDDPKPTLSLSQTKLELKEGETSAKIDIKGGKSPFEVKSSSTDTATVKLATKDFTVTGVKKGKATVTVKDKDGKTVSLAVTVAEKAKK